MKFSKTKNTIQEISSRDKINLSDFMAVIRDMIRDINGEMGISLEQLEITDEAIVQWMSVVRLLLKLQIEESEELLLERQKESLHKLRDGINNKDNNINRLNDEIQENAQCIKELKIERDKYQKLYNEKKELEKNAFEIKKEIFQIKERLKKYDNISINSLTEKKVELEKHESENKKLFNEVNKTNKKLEEEKARFNKKKTELEDIKNKLSEIQEKKKIYNIEIGKLAIEIEAGENFYETLKTNLNEKQHTLSVKKTALGIIDDKIKSFSDEIAKIDSDKYNLEKECGEILNIIEVKNQEFTELEKKYNNMLQDKKIVEDKIDKLSQNQKNIINEIARKQKSIEESNPEKLKTELNRITAEYNIIKEKNDSIQRDIDNKKNQIAVLHPEQQRLNEECAKIKKDYDEKFDNLNNSRKCFEENANMLENLKKDIAEFEGCFTAEFCEKQKREIENCRKVVQIYEEAVKSLFGRAIPPKFLNEEAVGLFIKNQELLQNQLDEINGRLCDLKDEYIRIITETERTINQYAM